MTDGIGFPILGTGEFIPYDLVKQHERQAILNHGQNIDTLASRGGLSYEELAAVLYNSPFNKNLSLEKAKKAVDIAMDRWLFMRPLNLDSIKLTEKVKSDPIELRPCIIKSPSNKPRVEMKAYFHKWCDKTEVSAFGTTNSVVGLVEYEDGKLGQWSPENIQFTDR